MAVYQENRDGTISTIIEDITIGQIEERIKDSVCIESTCGMEIRAAVSKPNIVLDTTNTVGEF